MKTDKPILMDLVHKVSLRAWGRPGLVAVEWFGQPEVPVS